ncbi:MAG: efflux RND transporter periplasmic adaptor subunit [bacterium]|nr:efflux RND transporter periplasmic adaptor subunit [bacterium]
MKQKLVLALGIGLFVAATAFVLKEKLPFASAASKTHEVTKTAVSEALTLTGEIDAQEKITLRFQTSGLLSWIGVKEGDAVKKYQTVATLDQRKLKKSLEKELNDYMNERWDFEQAQDDNETKMKTDAIKRILEKAQFDLNNTVLDVELENLSLELSFLTTPISGIITRVGAPYAGVNITPTQGEIDVINPATVYLSVLADQTEVTKLASDSHVTIKFDAYPDDTVRGLVKTIAFTPKSGETSTVYEVQITFDADPSKYRIGMTADAIFELSEKRDILIVPPEFVKKQKSGSTVTKNVAGKKQTVPVEVGEKREDGVEIISGVAEGDVLYD